MVCHWMGVERGRARVCSSVLFQRKRALDVIGIKKECAGLLNCIIVFLPLYSS